MIIADKHVLTEGNRDQWIGNLANGTANGLRAKFLAGQQEHGGDIGNVQTIHLLNELMNEHYDALAYIAEIRRRIHHGSDVIIMSKGCAQRLREAININNLTPVQYAAVRLLEKLIAGVAETGV